MVPVEAIAQTRNAGCDLVELDAFLAPICAESASRIRMSRLDASIPRFLTNMASDVWWGWAARRGRTKAAKSGIPGGKMQEKRDVVEMIRWSDGHRQRKGLQPDSPSRLGVCRVVVLCGGGWERRRSRFSALHSFKARVVDRVGTRPARILARHCTPPIKQTASGDLCPTMHLPTPGVIRPDSVRLSVVALQR